MLAKAVALAILSLVPGFLLRAAEIVPDPFAPAQLTGLYIEKDEDGTSTTLRLAGDAVVYKVSQGFKVVETLTVHPSGDDWFHFIEGLNTAKVYKWAPRYAYPGKGASWVIDLATDDRKFTSSGTNEYPRDGTENEPAADPKAGPSLAFQLFWQAALGLVGKAQPATTTPSVEKDHTGQS